MTELSNAVKVLIARMETNPDDFRHGNRFGGVADALWNLVGVENDMPGALWFLNETDKQALRDAWAKVHYGYWEKDIMEKVFDEGYNERQAEQERQMQAMKQQMYQHQLLQQKAAQNAMTGITPLHNSTIQGGNYNGGLLSQAGSAFQGLFK